MPTTAPYTLRGLRVLQHGAPLNHTYWVKLLNNSAWVDQTREHVHLSWCQARLQWHQPVSLTCFNNMSSERTSPAMHAAWTGDHPCCLRLASWCSAFSVFELCFFAVDAGVGLSQMLCSNSLWLGDCRIALTHAVEPLSAAISSGDSCAWLHIHLKERMSTNEGQNPTFAPISWLIPFQ